MVVWQRTRGAQRLQFCGIHTVRPILDDSKTVYPFSAVGQRLDEQPVGGTDAEYWRATEVRGLDRTNGRIGAVRTNRGSIKAGLVLNCTAGWSTLISDMARVPLPITAAHRACLRHRAGQAALDVVIVSSQMDAYISQSDGGEFVMGSEIEPWSTYRTSNTLNFRDSSWFGGESGLLGLMGGGLVLG